MAARATRSASRKARLTEAVATGPLGALSHDELGVIVDGLADPLQPVVAVALSSTCLGLRTPLLPALQVLKERHARVLALCRKIEISCALLRDVKALDLDNMDLTANDMATFGMILRTNGLPQLQLLNLYENKLDDTAMHNLCGGLGFCALSSLRYFNVAHNVFGPEGAEDFAAALRRGAMPKLQNCLIYGNRFGNEGLSALAQPLRKLTELTSLLLFGACGIGDEGVASLVDNLDKDDFPSLEELTMHGNSKITSAGNAKIVAAVEAGGLPKLHSFLMMAPPGDKSVQVALQRRRNA